VAGATGEIRGRRDATVEIASVDVLTDGTIANRKSALVRPAS
jgi:hypothetical protein